MSCALFLVRGQEHQRVLVRFRVHDPGAVAGHGLAGRDVQGTGYGAFVDLAVGAGVDEGQGVLGQACSDDARCASSGSGVRSPMTAGPSRFSRFIRPK